jgi:release factor glutamine methyltransferase
METDTIPIAPKILGTAKVLGSVLNTKYNARESEYLSRLLVEFVIAKPYKWVLMHPEAVFSPDEFFAWNAAAQRLLAMEPIQYIIGKAWFMDLELFVAPGVLIPRPETEELVTWLLENCEDAPLNIVDIGTGSGCLALSIAKAQPKAAVVGLDISAEALEIARKNAANLGIAVDFQRMNVLQADEATFQHLDFIICNPPYIPEQERTSMEANVVAHEPALALFVPDSDPLLFYNKVASLSLHWLKPGGELFFEVHVDFGVAVLEMMQGLGYADVELRKDMSGRDRMIRGKKAK